MPRRALGGFITRDLETFVIGNLDRLKVESWDTCVATHPHRTLFCSAGWLKALQTTYDLQINSVALYGVGGLLRSALVLGGASGLPSRQRLVSLPFSDHCQPLVASGDELRFLLCSLLQREGKVAAGSSPNPQSEAVLWSTLQTGQVDGRGWSLPAPHSPLPTPRSIELRPLDDSDLASVLLELGFGPSQRFHYHEIDLTPGAEAVLRRTHRDSVQRKLRRAEREGLEYRVGRSQDLVDDFYRLLVLTRRRHGVPPQPRKWFGNLVDCMGESLQIRVSYAGKVAVAAILTLTFRDQIVFKYGASDERYSAAGGTQMIFWKTIEEACGNGFTKFDLGRTDLDNPGLATFKERLGGERRPLTYWRFPAPSATEPGFLREKFGQSAHAVLRVLPPKLLELIGRLVYRHLA